MDASELYVNYVGSGNKRQIYPVYNFSSGSGGPGSTIDLGAMVGSHFMINEILSRGNRKVGCVN